VIGRGITSRRPDPPAPANRAAFLRTAGRWAALTVLGGLFATLISRRNTASTTGCRQERICSRCPIAEDCVQPEAMSLRAVRKGPRP
jgi:hypothetical protein